jgi:hypothetical protein
MFRMRFFFMCSLQGMKHLVNVDYLNHLGTFSAVPFALLIERLSDY